DAHDFDREIGRLLDEKLKTLLVNWNEFAFRASNGGGRSRRSIDHGHLAKDAAGLHDLDGLVADVDFDFAFVHAKHEVTRISRTENRFAGGKGLAFLISEHVELGHTRAGLV